MKNSTEIKDALNKKEYDKTLLDIYIDEERLDYQRNRYVSAVNKFTELYGERAIEIYSAPGRSEVGGNHTDHQHCQVLAAGLNIDIIAVVSKREDGIIKVVSDSYDIKEIDLTDLDKKDKEEGTSEGLIRGVAYKFNSDSINVGGFDAYMTSDVLQGSGMSSSAAFEVVIGTILSGLYNDMSVSPIYIAQASQYAENVYFNKPCGLMDQMASSIGSLVNIDFKDVKNPTINKIEIDFAAFNHSLCIVDTKGNHANLTPEYAAIPIELKGLCKYFGKEYLREIDEKEFYEKINEVRAAAGDRAVLRAMHVYADHRRVDLEVEALKAGDFERFKELIIESGRSSFMYLQNVYPNIDVQNQSVSLGLALSERLLLGKGAWRVHGGGFAGTIQAFVPNELVDEYKKEMEYYFGEDCCYVLKIRKYGGMKVL